MSNVYVFEISHMSYVFQAALNTEDPQYQDKRMVAQRNGKLSVQTFQVCT